MDNESQITCRSVARLAHDMKLAGDLLHSTAFLGSDYLDLGEDDLGLKASEANQAVARAFELLHELARENARLLETYVRAWKRDSV